ncbi:hypothetical protein AN993_06600, partial [Stenotrophomonas maltophilia]
PMPSPVLHLGLLSAAQAAKAGPAASAAERRPRCSTGEGMGTCRDGEAMRTMRPESFASCEAAQARFASIQGRSGA